jgi:hypothetical protein
MDFFEYLGPPLLVLQTVLCFLVTWIMFGRKSACLADYDHRRRVALQVGACEAAGGADVLPQTIKDEPFTHREWRVAVVVLVCIFLWIYGSFASISTVCVALAAMVSSRVHE